MFKILVVSLPDSPKRAAMAQRLSAQGLSWEWIDGVRISSMEEIPPEERSDLEAYGVQRLKNAPEYVCRAVGCKRAMRRAIARASASLEEWVLILQDDAVLADSFHSGLTALLARVPAEAGCVMLHWRGNRVGHKNDWTCVTGDIRSMTAFVLRPSFAQVMLRALEHWGRETDRIWEHLARQGQLILCAAPKLVSCTQEGSDIIGGIPELKKLWQ